MARSAGTKFRSSDEAAAGIHDAATVAITGSGGGLMEPDELLAAIERRFLATGKPLGLTVIHAQGIGDGSRRGLNRLAYEGLVRKVIGAHWSWSPRMQELAAQEKMEAYTLPGGVIQHLLRATGAGRPGLITHIGLNTMVDPRLQGGRMNASAKDLLNEVMVIDGREYLRYLPLKIDVALLRGSLGDPDGNVSFEEEGAELDGLVIAIAAHNSGGRVVVQVRKEVDAGVLPARSVRLPGALVDVLVAAPAQPQSHGSAQYTDISGVVRSGNLAIEREHAAAMSVDRAIIASRAALELRDGTIVSFGFGMPDGVAALTAQDGRLQRCYQTLDHGHYGGAPLKDALFGYVRNGEALIDSPTQFDFYSGGGIDIAFLGFGEIDKFGNVNASRLGGRIVGPGGFIDISQGSRKIVFCGTFEAKDVRLSQHSAGFRIDQPGKVTKFVDQVSEVTFSAARARATGQEVLYVTERAVFRLVEGGLALEELTPGLDLQRDVLNRMRFKPMVGPGTPKPMAGLSALLQSTAPVG